MRHYNCVWTNRGGQRCARLPFDCLARRADLKNKTHFAFLEPNGYYGNEVVPFRNRTHVSSAVLGAVKLVVGEAATEL